MWTSPLSIQGIVLSVVLCLTACAERDEIALGTLEWDRIALPAPAAEKIVRIYVREGERVEAGQRLLDLDPSEALAKLNSAEAMVAREQAALIELRAGPRIEEIERAKADLAAARANQVDSEADYQRLLALGKKDYASRSDIDGARAAAESARAQVRAALEQVQELERGTRVEDIDQGEASLAAARAQANAQRVLLDKLSLRAPRAGVVDSIPFKLGDQAPVGGALVILLSGVTPYARVYVPQSLRRNIAVGGRARVTLDSRAVRANTLKKDAAQNRHTVFDGRVRMVRNEPSFTPYYALTGDDVARLSYIAEIQLRKGVGADRLPAGLPLQVIFLPGTVSEEEYPQSAAMSRALDPDSSYLPEARGNTLPNARSLHPSHNPESAAPAVRESDDGGK
ncbi:HlyD family secretion protein [Microbulbifer sp. HZ11]|uniref:HlyD family secretion protein n=1 Tax=unclassified Microbulbifer TaxID=2619833 RepID=UPI0009DDC53E|nr:biotin/lipoyl-binding protein [Microbulbifer sp. HZ11]